MLPGIRFSSRGRRRAVVVGLVAAAVAVSGCSSQDGKQDGKRKSAGSGASSRAAQGTSHPGGGKGGTPTPKSKSKSVSKPRTAVEFVARARQTMAAEKGWTFALRGNEWLVMRGQAPTGATYAATAQRTTAPMALHQTGTITSSKGERKPELVYVVGGTGYVMEDGGSWKKGSLSDPDIANDVEDPVAELDAFAAYAKSAKVSSTGAPGGGVRLQVTASRWRLSAARNLPALKRAVREIEPALGQLRGAGVTATDDQMSLKSFDETWDLDPTHGYRLTAHRYSFTFLVPFQGGDITLSQEVRAENRGVFTGSVTLPPDVNGRRT